MARQPEGPPPPPVVQRVRIRYAKRGRLRFTSHRDFARAFERALRRAGVPIAYSAGFTPHPKISYAGAAPTGVASEAEYLEIGPGGDRRRRAAAGGAGRRAAARARRAGGVQVRPGTGALADRVDASSWRIELPGVAPAELEAALAAFLAADEVQVERLTKTGRRQFDARAAVVSAESRRRRPADDELCDT